MSQRQEVNLYLPKLQPKMDYLAGPLAVRGLLLVVAIFFVITGFDVVQNYRLQQAVEQRQTQIDGLSQQIADVKGQLPKSQGAKLDREIKRLGLEIARRQAISRLIDGESIGNTQGFSDQLVALSRQSSEQLSLTTFAFASGGQVVSLTGHTRSPEAVPGYIDRLRQSDSFSDSVFGPMAIARQDNHSVLIFSLNHTKPEGGKNE